MLPIMAVSAMVFLAIYALLIQSQMEQELHDKVLLVAKVHSLTVAEPLWTLNMEGLERSVQTIVVHPEITCAEVLESDEHSRFSWPGDCSAVAEVDQLHTTALTFHNQPVGQLKLYYSDVPLIDSLTHEVLIGALFFFLLAVVAGIVAFGALKLIVGKPLSRLLNSIESTEQGGSHNLVSWNSHDEMGSVIGAYNRMVKQADSDTQDLIVAREQAEQAVETKSRFLANMSHELRTPLNAVIGITEMLKEEAEDQNLDTEPHARVAAAGRHLLELIDNVLDFSKIEADKIELSPEPIETHDFLLDLVATAEPLAAKNHNELKLETENIPESMTIDVTRLRQIILNLLGNACKFTDHGTIILNAEGLNVGSQAKVRFTVSDTGIGISEEKCRALFDEFSQADTSTTRQYGGTGLGLAISQRLCELMGSRISVSSQIDKGSEFSFEVDVNADEYD